MMLKLHLVKKYILINQVNCLFNTYRLYILKMMDRNIFIVITYKKNNLTSLTKKKTYIFLHIYNS